jgi:Protein of unknown function (DUF2961)
MVQANGARIVIGGSQPGQLSLAENTPQAVTAEYAGLPNQGSAVNLLSLPAGTEGTVSKIQLILHQGGGGMTLDGRLQISYDGGNTFPFDVDLGTLFGTHFSSGDSTDSPWQGACSYLDAIYDYNSYLAVNFRYPIPFSNGVLIRLFNYTSGSPDDNYFCKVTYALGAPASPYRLRSTGATAAANAASGSNITTGSGGWTINNPNVALNNGSNSLLGMSAGANAQLAYLTGKGWIVGLAVMMHQTGADLTWMERDFGFYFDGALQPTLGGAVTTPAAGGAAPNTPHGAGIGSPTIQTSGVEDTFDLGYYGTLLTDWTYLSKPQAIMWSNATERSGTWCAYHDFLGTYGGYKFNESFNLWLLTESRVLTTHEMSWAVLYYQ